MKSNAVIIEGARTPIGSFLGGLRKVSPTDLGTVAAKAALERSKIPASEVGALYFGNVLQSSKDAVYLARHIGLNVGAPIEAAALVVNRACASGLEALIQGHKAIAFDEAKVVLAGGAENMSMTPYSMRGVREGWKMIKTDVDDMLFSALHDPKAGCSIGETVEHLAAEVGIDRKSADEAALRGQQRTAASKDALAEEITPVEITKRKKIKVIDLDESPRPESTLDGLSALPGLFKKDGIVTAGNSCGLNDAGAAVVMASEDYAKTNGCKVLGRVLSWASVGVAPLRMGMGPVGASNLALSRAGLSIQDMDIIELNDSFSVQMVAIERAMKLNPEKVNPNGGAIALGHPMAATGTRLVLSALYQLRRSGGKHALCTVCVGGGQGTAVVVSA